MKLFQKHNLRSLWQPAVVALWAMACWAFFQHGYAYHFFYQEQTQLFLLAPSYVASYLHKPAWLAMLTGDFITQFYYYLYAGAAILTLSLLVFGHLLRIALQRITTKGWATIAALIAMTYVATACLDSSLRLPSLISLIGGTAIYLLTPRRWADGRWGISTILLSSCLTYWLFGYGAFVCLALHMAYAYIIIGVKRATVRLAIVPVFVGVVMMQKSLYLLPYPALLAYPGIPVPHEPEFLVEQTLAADCEYLFGNDRKVMRMVEETPAAERTKQATFFYFLASARQGTLAENVLKVVPGDLGVFHRIGPQTPTTTLRSMNELYYLLGDMTFAERAATLGMVTSTNNRNVRMAKRLAEINMVKGDTAAASKYLRLLSHTLVYKKWADAMTNNPSARKRYEMKREFTNTKDTLRLSDHGHVLLCELLESNPQNEAALHYLLCADLLMKELKTFKTDYDRFCMATNRPRHEAIYQQALAIYLTASDAPKEDWQRYITSGEVLREFAEYNKHRGSVAYNNTYWYYFDCKNPPKID